MTKEKQQYNLDSRERHYITAGWASILFAVVLELVAFVWWAAGISTTQEILAERVNVLETFANKGDRFTKQDESQLKEYFQVQIDQQNQLITDTNKLIGKVEGSIQRLSTKLDRINDTVLTHQHPPYNGIP